MNQKYSLGVLPGTRYEAYQLQSAFRNTHTRQLLTYKRACLRNSQTAGMQESAPLETLQAMLLGLEAKQEVEAQADTDTCGQEAGNTHAVMQADSLGLDSPRYKAVRPGLCRHCGPAALKARQHTLCHTLTHVLCFYRRLQVTHSWLSIHSKSCQLLVRPKPDETHTVWLLPKAQHTTSCKWWQHF